MSPKRGQIEERLLADKSDVLWCIARIYKSIHSVGAHSSVSRETEVDLGLAWNAGVAHHTDRLIPESVCFDALTFPDKSSIAYGGDRIRYTHLERTWTRMEFSAFLFKNGAQIDSLSSWAGCAVKCVLGLCGFDETKTEENQRDNSEARLGVAPIAITHLSPGIKKNVSLCRTDDSEVRKTRGEEAGHNSASATHGRNRDSLRHQS